MGWVLISLAGVSMILLNARLNRQISRRYPVFLLVCYCALAFQGFTPVATAQAPNKNKKVSAPVHKANQEAYHVVDPTRDGFLIEASFNSMSVSAMVEIVDGEIVGLTLRDLSRVCQGERISNPAIVELNEWREG